MTTALITPMLIRFATAEKEYADAFQDEYKSFLTRVHERAEVCKIIT